MTVVIHKLPWRSRGVRILKEGSTETETSCVVAPSLFGGKLWIGMLRGNPRQPWRELAAEHFPTARWVHFERMTEDGLRPRPPLKLKPLSYWQLCVVALRAFYRT